MAKIIGQIEEREIKARIRQAKRVRFNKPLKVSVGAALKRAMEAKVETTSNPTQS